MGHDFMKEKCNTLRKNYRDEICQGLWGQRIKIWNMRAKEWEMRSK